MPHFFISENEKIDNTKIVINDCENYNHIARSLRSRVGEKLLLIDNSQIQYETEITAISSNTIECRIVEAYKSHRNLDFDLYLAQAPLRSDAQLTIAEKATELGVRGIYPIITENCSINYEMASKKQKKWQRVMYEASKQCERATIPCCYEPTSLETVLEKKFDKILILGERCSESSLKQYLIKNKITPGDKILVVIGPEGGFSQTEFDLFKERNYPILSLGDLILKAETAVIVTLGDIIYEYKG